jgi:hypothetical protein
VIIAMLGAVFMVAISANLILAHPDPYIGAHLYDLYAKALGEGRFNLLARELRYESHFAPDGTSYLYYGLGSVLTRLPFLPFVDMPTTWISALSIWFYSAMPAFTARDGLRSRMARAAMSASAMVHRRCLARQYSAYRCRCLRLAVSGIISSKRMECGPGSSV